MNSSRHSNSPIVLTLKQHDVSVTHPVTANSIQLNVNRNKTKINIIIDKKSTTVPGHYYDAVWLLLHHLDVYKQMALRLTRYPELNMARNEYTSIVYYYCDVLLAFVDEVKSKWRRDSKTWRSAHLDYHLAMSINNFAFTKPMQMAVLAKINRTWDDFVNQKDFTPVHEMTIQSYHNEFCNGQDMCGVEDPSHKSSVEDMVVSALNQAMARLPTPRQGEKISDDHQNEMTTKDKTMVGPIESSVAAGTPSAAVPDEMDEVMRLDTSQSGMRTHDSGDNHGQDTSTGSDVYKAIDMAKVYAQTKHDSDMARKKKAVGAKNGARKESHIKQDATENAPKAIETTADGRKGHNNRTSGGKDKSRQDTTRSNASVKQARETRSRPPKGSRLQAHRDEMVISDDEDVILAGHHVAVAQSEPNLPPASTHPQSRAQKAAKKGKRKAMVQSDDTVSRAKMASTKGKQKAIVMSDDEADDRGPDVTAGVDCNDPGDIHVAAATPEDHDYMDIRFPSAFEEWEEWHHTAFEKGNSQVFLKLATWILVRFRQLAHSPINGSVDGLLIPDHPASFEMDNDADYNEALGMTRLYAALLHVDTHPEYLCHLFHEIGKASFEGRLESSHPRLRPLPELPIPVLSMMSDEQFPWLTAASFDDSDRSDDMDAEGVVDDIDGDACISMALNDMVISGMQHPAVQESADALKRKRTMSKALSPAKADGGRGFPKRQRASRSEAFIRPSSPYVRPKAIPSASRSVASEPTGSKDVNIAHIPSPNERRVSVSHPDIISPSNRAHGARAVSDISNWTGSEEDIRMHISSKSSVDELKVMTEDTDHTPAGPSIGTAGISDSLDVGQAVATSSGEGGGARDESGAEVQLTNVTGLFDEDVRVFGPSTPE